MMTLEELNAILALPVGKNGNTSTASKKGDLIMQGVPFPGGAPIVAQGPRQHPLIGAAGLDPQQFAYNDPTSDLPMDQAPAMAVDGTAARNPVIEPAGGRIPAPEFYGAESLMSSGPMDITPQGYTDESKRTPSMSKWDQFMSRPGMGNALLAMGGAMLSGKSPAEAFGGGITAFGNTLEARRLNDLQQQGAEQDRLMRLMAARAKATSGSNALTGASDVMMGYDSSGNPVPARYSKSAQDFEYKVNGEWTPNAPEGWTRAQDNADVAGDKTSAGLDAKAIDKFYGELSSAESAAGIADRLIELAPTSGVGPDLLSQATRQLSTMLGVDINGVNFGNVKEFEALVSKLELAEATTQRGLGQLTEGERAIIRNTLPGLNQTQANIMRMAVRSKLRSEIMNEIADSWDALSPAEKRAEGGFRAYNRRESKKAFSEGAYLPRFKAAMAKAAPQDAQGGGGGNTGTPAPNTSSVRSRADAILSGN